MNPNYVLVLLQELQRLLPAPGSPDKNHLISWTRIDERDALVIMRCVGDCLFPYITTPDQLTDDPIETARRLVPAIVKAMAQEPIRLYTFKT